MCQFDFGGVNNAPAAPSPSLGDLRGVCGSFSSHTTTGSDNLNPALHLKHVCDDALDANAMIMTLTAYIGYCPAVFCHDYQGSVAQSDGRMETIGLFTSVLRAFLRCTRRGVTLSWGRGFAWPYWFGQIRAYPVSPPVEDGSEGRFSATPPALPDRCVWLAQVPAGGKRGDEGGAFGRWQGVCMQPRSCSWSWSNRSTTPSRNCPRSSLQWSWTIRSSRLSSRATRCRCSFSEPSTCSRRTLRRSQAQWFPSRLWKSSPTTRGFATTCAAARCTRALRTRRRNLRVDYACGGNHGDASDVEASAAGGSHGGEACQDCRRPLPCLRLRRDGHAACAAQRSADDRAESLP